MMKWVEIDNGTARPDSVSGLRPSGGRKDDWARCPRGTAVFEQRRGLARSPEAMDAG